MKPSAILLFSVVLLLALTTVALAGPVPPAKHVEINKTEQMLRAYEGNNLIFESHVSTGRWDQSTPNGNFSALEKSRMHYSRLYHHAPMPYSIHVTGNVFIHGFTSVPAWPDSHGCIRMPLSGINPAKRLYEWIEIGTPVKITGHWQGDRRHLFAF